MIDQHEEQSKAQPGSGVEAGSAASRQRLVEAAVACIGEFGWGNVRIREIGRRAGVNPGLVSYYFGSKDGLLLAAAEQAMRTELGAATEALAAAPDLERALGAVAAVIASIDPSSAGARVLAEVTLNASRDTRLRQAAGELLAGFRAEVARLVRVSQAAGTIPSGQDAEATAAVVAALLDGLLLHVLVDPGLELDRIGAALAAGMALGGTTPPPDTPTEES